jgi:hypothetical protein
MRHMLTFIAVSFFGVSSAAGQLVLDEAGDSPDQRVTVTMPGVYRAAVWQASGGGIMEFYDLAHDPKAEYNLVCRNRGLFEIGWHAGAASKDRGVRDWPSLWHQGLKAQGRLEVIEQSPARVRVRAESVFTWWQKFVDNDMPVTAIYTFYPCGQIDVQVRVQQKGESYTWSREYGPHLCFVAQKDQPERNPGYTFSTPKVPDFQDGFQGPAEELVLAVSPKIDARFLLTVPVESKQLFDRHMRHDGRSVNWDRAGYGSNGIVMAPGYDSTWACLIQFGTKDHPLAAEFKTAAESIPWASSYRRPAKISGATLVFDDAGDFNRDGFNESEGCHVLTGSAPLRFTYERGDAAGFAPAFKVLGWKGEAPRTVKVDGKAIPAAAAVVDGRLILQVLGRIDAAKAALEIGETPSAP